MFPQNGCGLATATITASPVQTLTPVVPPQLVAEMGRPRAAAGEDGAADPGGAQGGHAGHLELHEPQLPSQRLVLLVAAGDLQVQDGVAIVHQLADLRHGRVGQHLHDGGQLGVQLDRGGRLVHGRGCLTLILTNGCPWLVHDGMDSLMMCPPAEVNNAPPSLTRK